MSVPRLFGNYVLLHRLAQGSTSELYLAQTLGEFSRLCAVKLLRHDLAQIPEFGNRFREDAALLVRLIHGNLVQVLEVGCVEDQYFIAMELIEGIDLPELLTQTTPEEELPAEMAIFVGLEMCEALTYIHTRRRAAWGSASFPADMPWPMEVMVSFDGVVKVVDLGSFGAVRLGQQKVSRLFRSPGYAVPEVILKKPLDPRSDVFAVGMVIWELLHGRPLAALNAKDYVGQVLAGTWEAPLVKRRDVPGHVIRTVMKMLSLDPSRRPPRLEEVREPLVVGLRRLSPTYGSRTLSQQLHRRCAEHIDRIQEMTREAHQRGLAELPSEEQPTTLSFGRSGEADRTVKEPVELKQGERIPGTRYKMVRKLGGGGNAEVYAAQHIELDRQVAIKVISPKLARSSRAIDFFRAEARACSRVGHPNIVEVLDFGELEDGRFYFAMELLDGRSLDTVIRERGAMDPAEALGIGRQIARALQAVHKVGIIHRDLKPENVMLVRREERDDFVKILDFGGTAFAGQTEEDRVGTVGFMAPELVRGETATTAMDVYSLGVILYRMLCGELPYPAKTFEEFVEQQAKGQPRALRTRARGGSVPPALERVVHRALERDPGARQPSMADLEADLIQAQKDAGLETAWDDLPHPSAIQDRRVRRARPARRRPQGPSSGVWVAGGAIVGALIVIVLIVLSSRPSSAPTSRPDPPPPTATTVAPVDPTAQAKVATRESNLPSELRTLLRQAEDAADQGWFTRPRDRSALDIILKIEQVAPDNQETGRLRRRLARMLEGAADRLAQADLDRSARTLYREALLFAPDSKRLRQRAAPEKRGSDSGVSTATVATDEPSRPEASEAMVAWLVSMVQMAVSEGRYLSPPRNNALHFLWKLKQVDPKGSRTAEARESVVRSLHRRAQQLWKQENFNEARELYRSLLQMSPDDRLAQQRLLARPTNGRVASGPRPGSGGAKPSGPRGPTPAPPSPPATDPAEAARHAAEAKKLMDQGKFAAAKEKFAAARKAQPNNPEHLLGMATAAFELGQNREVVELCRRALSLGRRNVRALLLLGDAYFNLMRAPDAKKAWQQVLAIQPENKSAQRRMKRLEARDK